MAYCEPGQLLPLRGASSATMLRRLSRTGLRASRMCAASLRSTAALSPANCTWFPHLAVSGPMRVPAAQHCATPRAFATLRGRVVTQAAVATKPAPTPPPEDRTTEVELAAEASSSYLAYAMSVIVGRALPDVRDGLKPVHRCELPATALQPRYCACQHFVGFVGGVYSVASRVSTRGACPGLFPGVSWSGKTSDSLTLAVPVSQTHPVCYARAWPASE
jgi:hypothetical protein